jgi:exodeoxyribonuclease V alpha subunit
MPDPANSQIQINGLIERVTFHNPENGFCVLRIKVKGQKDLTTVIGNAQSVSPGEHIEARGVWINNRDHGLQLQAQQLKTIAPTTLEGMEKYLGSGMVKGIGPHFAKKLVKEFGLEVFDIIERQPEQLMSLEGIGKKRTSTIISAWHDQKVVREIMVFLQSHGVATAKAVRIYKSYGDQAIEKVTANPYRLALDIYGIGFQSADQIALNLNIPKDSIIRAQAGLRHILQEFSSEGHCAALQQNLIAKAKKLLTIPESTLEQALADELTAEHIISETVEQQNYIFLTALHKAEIGIANNLARLSSNNKPWPQLDIDQAISQIEKHTKVSLAPSQHQAVIQTLSNKVSVITGGPGVGKTTIVNTILKILLAKGISVKLAAPTGRAAKRMTQATGLEAFTIHRLLEFDPSVFGFKKNQDNQLATKFIVIDEVSMVDIVLMHQLLKAIPTNCSILLVGDVDQLPSVGPGSVLANIIGSHKVATSKLTEIFRQAASSQIITNAHRINAGELPNLVHNKETKTDFYFINAQTPEDIYQKLLFVVGKRIPHSFNLDPINDIQVLTPMNKGGIGARSLNIELQKLLNPDSHPQVTRYGWTFAPNDKVIQTSNNYDKEVFNGDIGTITHIDTEEAEVTINFDNKIVKYDFNELDEVSLAYATSIHKSQGSEYPAVVIPIAMQHYKLLERNLLYTAVTRGKKLVVIIGQKKALSMAVNSVKSVKRITRLQERIVEAIITS